MAPYQIFTDATADCSPHWLASLPPIGVIPCEQRSAVRNTHMALAKLFQRRILKGGKLCLDLSNHVHNTFSLLNRL